MQLAGGPDLSLSSRPPANEFFALAFEARVPARQTLRPMPHGWEDVAERGLGLKAKDVAEVDLLLFTLNNAGEAEDVNEASFTFCFCARPSKISMSNVPALLQIKSLSLSFSHSILSSPHNSLGRVSTFKPRSPQNFLHNANLTSRSPVSFGIASDDDGGCSSSVSPNILFPLVQNLRRSTTRVRC